MGAVVLLCGCTFAHSQRTGFCISRTALLLWAAMSRRLPLGLFLVSLSFLAFGQTAPTPSQQLVALLHDEWEFELRSSPEFATFLGDHRFDDQVSDNSEAAIRANIEKQRKFLERANQIQSAKLDADDELNLKLIKRKLQLDLDWVPLEPWLMPVTQMGGPHTEYAELAHVTSFRNAEDCDHYLTRLSKLPRAFEQITALMREGMKKGLMPPAYLLPLAQEQAEHIAAQKGEENPFAEPLKKLPDSFSEAERKRIRQQVLTAIDTNITPTYEKFAKFLKEEYVPAGRKEAGVWSLPQGEKRYALAIRQMTTTNMTAGEIHEIGLKEVARIEQEMLATAQKLGYKDLASFHEAIRKNPDLYGKSGEQILGLYKQHIDDISKDLPQLFGHLPKAKLDVIPMASYRSAAEVPADYSPGSVDGARPGHVNVNMSDPTHRLLLNVEAIAYHEGVPGHHLQLSLQHELTNVPEFRKVGEYTSYVEGWALYSERLGKEIGYYKDPYSEYGRLENEMWRAVRLVVDTGVHSKHWTRQQMVDYFHKYTAMDEPNINTEVDRYIAWPGQALAYKVGQMTILRLREQAKQQLGSKFDLRAFHDELLGAGALPMDVLEERMNAWIQQQKSK
jgi:uncharacterized protein (DUF885 family)